MARNRMIRPEFWEDDKIGECLPIVRLLFVALWNFADDQGFVEYRVKWLKAKCLPYDDVQIELLIDELVAKGFVEIKNNIIWVKNFLKHQRIDKPQPSDLSQRFKNSKNVPGTLDEHSSPKIEVKLSKVEVKVSEKETTNVVGDKSPDEVNEIFKIFYKINPTIKFGDKTSRKAVEELIEKFGFEMTVKFAESAIALHGTKFAPTITTPYQLKEKLSALVAYLKAHQSGQNNLITTS